MVAANKRNSGFTLVELIVVIVILGILAATALPKYLSMRRQARIAALNGLMGGIHSGVAMTIAARSVQPSQTMNFPGWAAYMNFPYVMMGSSVVLVGDSSYSFLSAPGVPAKYLTGIGSLMGCTPVPEGVAWVGYDLPQDCGGFIVPDLLRPGWTSSMPAHFFAPGVGIKSSDGSFDYRTVGNRCYLEYYQGSSAPAPGTPFSMDIVDIDC